MHRLRLLFRKKDTDPGAGAAIGELSQWQLILLRFKQHRLAVFSF